MEEIIKQIVKPEYVDSWVGLDPKIYYKNGKPYGMMVEREILDRVMIASTVTNPDLPFTYNMIKRIKQLYQERKICLITDNISKQEHIRNCFKRYKFEYMYDENGVMYSLNVNHD